jgi:hypothetical protein
MFDIQIQFQFRKNPPLCKAERLDGCAQRRKMEFRTKVDGRGISVESSFGSEWSAVATGGFEEELIKKNKRNHNGIYIA